MKKFKLFTNRLIYDFDVPDVASMPDLLEAKGEKLKTQETQTNQDIANGENKAGRQESFLLKLVQKLHDLTPQGKQGKVREATYSKLEDVKAQIAAKRDDMKADIRVATSMAQQRELGQLRLEQSRLEQALGIQPEKQNEVVRFTETIDTENWPDEQFVDYVNQHLMGKNAPVRAAWSDSQNDIYAEYVRLQAPKVTEEARKANAASYSNRPRVENVEIRVAQK